MRGLKYSHLMDGASFLGPASTQEPYELYDMGPFPAASPGGDRILLGELYAIDDGILERLDVLEGHPELYRRAVRPLSDGRAAWLYEIVHGTSVGDRLRHAPRVPGGDWRDWLARREAT
jgi:gamma-glutamylaminecyclotransferase